jgi:hypothetical protein
MFKIEYDPDYSHYRYVVYKLNKGWLSKTWVRVASFETEETAKDAIKTLADYPKYF